MNNEIIYVSPDKIFPNLYQPRKYFDEGSLDELAQSIKNYGIIQPISVRKMGEEHFELVAGERRLRAAKKLGLSEIPVILINISESDSAAIALLENLQREDLNYMEEAEAYLSLIQEHNYTQDFLADSIGKKQSTIANKLRLLKLSKDIRNKLISNSLTERHARALLKLPTEKEQLIVLDTIIKKQLNVRETDEYIEKYLLKKEMKAKNEKIKNIKMSMNPKIYINTVKQVFKKFNVNASYSFNEDSDKIDIVISIPKSLKK